MPKKHEPILSMVMHEKFLVKSKSFISLLQSPWKGNP